MQTDMPNGAYPAFQGPKKPGRVMRPGPGLTFQVEIRR